MLNGSSLEKSSLKVWPKKDKRINLTQGLRSCLGAVFCHWLIKLS